MIWIFLFQSIGALTLNELLKFADFFELGFTPCKAEQPLQDMELYENEAQKD